MFQCLLIVLNISLFSMASNHCFDVYANPCKTNPIGIPMRIFMDGPGWNRNAGTMVYKIWGWRCFDVREARMWLFGHILRRDEEDTVKVAFESNHILYNMQLGRFKVCISYEIPLCFARNLNEVISVYVQPPRKKTSMTFFLFCAVLDAGKKEALALMEFYLFCFVLLYFLVIYAIVFLLVVSRYGMNSFWRTVLYVLCLKD